MVGALGRSLSWKDRLELFRSAHAESLTWLGLLDRFFNLGLSPWIWAMLGNVYNSESGGASRIRGMVNSMDSFCLEFG